MAWQNKKGDLNKATGLNRIAVVRDRFGEVGLAARRHAERNNEDLVFLAKPQEDFRF